MPARRSSMNASGDVRLLQSVIDRLREALQRLHVDRDQRLHLAHRQLHSASDRLQERVLRMPEETTPECLVGRQFSDHPLYVALTHHCSSERWGISRVVPRTHGHTPASNHLETRELTA